MTFWPDEDPSRNETLSSGMQVKKLFEAERKKKKNGNTKKRKTCSAPAEICAVSLPVCHQPMWDNCGANWKYVEEQRYYSAVRQRNIVVAFKQTDYWCVKVYHQMTCTAVVICVDEMQGNHVQICRAAKHKGMKVYWKIIKFYVKLTFH